MVLKMVEVTVEERGRILIPKDIREKIGLRGGEKLEIRVKNGEIVLNPRKPVKDIEKLRGCVEDSEIDPLEAKKMWEM